MANVPSATNDYTLGRGALFFAPFATGTQNPTGERFFGDVNTFDLSFKSTDLDHYSSVSGVKEMDDSVVLQVDRTGQFVTENINPENLALFFLGSSSKITQSASTVSAEVHNGVQPDRFYQLGATNTNPAGNRTLDPASAAVVTDDAGTPVTFAAGTDYVVDYDLGRIYIVPGGAITSGKNLKVSYHILAASRDHVISGNQALEGQLRFVSFNPNGSQKDVIVPWVRISPNGNFSLIGDKFNALTFDLKVLKKTAYNLEAVYIDGRGVSS